MNHPENVTVIIMTTPTVCLSVALIVVDSFSYDNPSKFSAKRAREGRPRLVYIARRAACVIATVKGDGVGQKYRSVSGRARLRKATRS